MLKRILTLGDHKTLPLHGIRPARRDTGRSQDTAGSPTRRRAQTWSSLFIAPCASLFFAPWTSAARTTVAYFIHHVVPRWSSHT